MVHTGLGIALADIAEKGYSTYFLHRDIAESLFGLRLYQPHTNATLGTPIERKPTIIIGGSRGCAREAPHPLLGEILDPPLIIFRLSTPVSTRQFCGPISSTFAQRAYKVPANLYGEARSNSDLSILKLPLTREPTRFDFFGDKMHCGQWE